MQPPDLPTEPPRPPDTKMRLRRTSSLSGQNLCPSCGTVLGEGVVFCVACGYDLVAKRRRETARKVSGGLAAWRFLDGFFKGALRLLVVLLLLAFIVFFGARAWAAYKARAPEAAVSSLCASCRGQGKMPCGGCGGSGVAERMESKTCGSCKGTGRYDYKLKRGASSCPHCGGKGTWQEPAMRTCAACDGHRVVTCTACGGTGRKPKR